jgi:hypothetical protein
MLGRYDEYLLLPEPETAGTSKSVSPSLAESDRTTSALDVTSPPNDMKSPSVEQEKTPLRQADSDRKAAASSKRKRQDF